MLVHIVIKHGIYETEIIKVFASALSANDYLRIHSDDSDIWYEVQEMKLEA